MLHCDICRNRRCLDPLLPSSIQSVLKSSPAGENSPCSPSLSKSVIPDSSDGSSCKRLSFDETASIKQRQGVVEVQAKTAAPGGTVSDVSNDGSAGQSTGSTSHRRSRKFTDATTWSRFRQQKATALKSCSSAVC